MAVCACTTSNTNPLHYCQLAPHTQPQHVSRVCNVHNIHNHVQNIIRLHYENTIKIKMDEKYFERERESTVVLVEMRIV